MRRIVYLENSGFALELEGLLLAFDICSSKPVPGKRGLAGGVVDEESLRPFERRALFFSHSHRDHYDPAAFRLPGCEKYISFEFPKSFAGVRMEPGQELERDGLWIKAFGSTDLGVSFLVRAQGLCLFHAGDFNLWHWREESTPQEIQEAYALYEAVLQPLLPYGDRIDVAFFPVDPRMGKTTMEGALDFAARLRPRLTIPMHMQGDAALGLAFERAMAEQNRAAKCLPHRGDWLDIDQALQTGGHEA